MFPGKKLLKDLLSDIKSAAEAETDEVRRRGYEPGLESLCKIPSRAVATIRANGRGHVIDSLAALMEPEAEEEEEDLTVTQVDDDGEEDDGEV